MDSIVRIRPDNKNRSNELEQDDNDVNLEISSNDGKNLCDTYNSRMYNLDMVEKRTLRSLRDNTEIFQESSRVPPSKILFSPFSNKEDRSNSIEEVEEAEQNENELKRIIPEKNTVPFRTQTIKEEKSFLSSGSQMDSSSASLVLNTNQYSIQNMAGKLDLASESKIKSAKLDSYSCSENLQAQKPIIRQSILLTSGSKSKGRPSIQFASMINNNLSPVHVNNSSPVHTNHLLQSTQQNLGMTQGLSATGRRASHNLYPGVFRFKNRVKSHNPLQAKKRSLFNVLSQFYIAKTFIFRLRNQSGLRKSNYLKEKHYNMIDDYACQYSYLKDTEKMAVNHFKHLKKLKTSQAYRLKMSLYNITMAINRILAFSCSFRIFGIHFECSPLTFTRNCLQKIVTKIKTPLDPNQKFCLFWDIFQAFLILVFFFLVPIQVCFNVYLFQIVPSRQSLTNVNLIYFVPLFFFFFDIFINFNKGFYRKGKLILTRKEISYNYLRRNFFSHTLCVLPFLLEYFYAVAIYDKQPDDATSYKMIDVIIHCFKLIFFLRVNYFKKIYKEIEDYFFFDDKSHSFTRLLILFGKCIFIAHLFACIWHLVAFLQTGNQAQRTWLDEADVASENLWVKYLYAFYFVTVTMNTVGFGDITPQNKFEVLFSIPFIFSGCAFFAYFISNVDMILQEINRRQKEFNTNMNIINRYFNKKNIPFELRMQIKKYLEYVWNEEKAQNEEEELSIINSLSKTLREELLLEANGNIVKNLPMFFKNFGEDVLRKIVFSIKEIRFTPGDIVFMEKDTDDASIYIVRKGEIEIFAETHRNKEHPMTVLRKLRKGEIFGEVSFFSGRPRSSSARSLDFSTVYVIKRDDFLTILEHHPRDFEIFSMIKDEINLYNNHKKIYMKCYACNDQNHIIKNCGMLHFEASQHRVIAKHSYWTWQERIAYLRKLSKSPNAMKSSLFVEKRAYEFQHNELEKHLESESEFSKDFSNDHYEEEEDPDDEWSDDEDTENQGFTPNKKSDKFIARRSTKTKGVVFNEEPAATRLDKSFIKQKSANKLDERHRADKDIGDIEQRSNYPESEKPSYIHQKTLDRRTSLLKRLETKGKADAERKDLLGPLNDMKFDLVKNFVIYFPHNNIKKVIQDQSFRSIPSLRKKRTLKNTLKKDFLLGIFHFGNRDPHARRFSTVQRSKLASTNDLLKKRFFRENVAEVKVMNDDVEIEERFRAMFNIKKNKGKRKKGFIDIMKNVFGKMEKKKQGEYDPDR